MVGIDNSYLGKNYADRVVKLRGTGAAPARGGGAEAEAKVRGRGGRGEGGGIKNDTGLVQRRCRGQKA
jgi:hypothetical protein